MAYYIGGKELLDALNKFNADNNVYIKGLTAEIEVGKLLKKHLPDDTIIVAHPQIGRYDPDFLVISPRYGFRIIEVKNLNPATIFNIETNGTISLNNRSIINPMSQVKRHRDELWKYLETNYGIARTTVDCLVLLYSFTKAEFISAYDKDWDTTFYKNTIFRDQLDNGIEDLLRYSSKFTSIGLGKEKIRIIIDHIKISDEIFNEESYRQELTKKEIELEESKNEVQSKEREIVKRDKEEGHMKKLIYIVIALLVIMIIGLYALFSGSQPPDPEEIIKNSPEAISEIVQDKSNVGRHFELTLIIEDFSYNADSETKFLILSDGIDKIDGVIFKGVEGIPYIEENKSYTISGTLNTYNSEYQIVIDGVH